MKTSPIQHNTTAQPVQSKSRAGKAVRLALLGLLGTGVTGNGVWTYQNIQNQTKTNTELTKKLEQSETTATNLLSQMGSLNQELNVEKAQNKVRTKELEQSKGITSNLSSQVSTLSQELNREKEQGKITTANLMAQINNLNKELNSKITLDQIMDIAAMVTPATVMVEGEVEMFNPFTGEKRKGTVTGSGVIISDNNGKRYILTNGHVIEDSEIRRNGKDGVYHIKLYNGSDYKKPIEFDAAPVILSNGQRAYSAPDENDLALLQIPADVKLPDNLVVKMRDTTETPFKVGEPVIAVGNPFREKDSVSFGIISHTDRKSEIDKNYFLQTDAAINPGNSGGGLFDMQGRLAGINTWGYRNTNGVSGSIRIDEVKRMLEKWGIPVTSAKEKEALKLSNIA